MGCKDIGIRKSEFEARAHFIQSKSQHTSKNRLGFFCTFSLKTQTKNYEKKNLKIVFESNCDEKEQLAGTWTVVCEIGFTCLFQETYYGLASRTIFRFISLDRS